MRKRESVAQRNATEREFRVVYDRHFDDVARYCLRRLPQADAHEAVSEVFLVAWRRFESLPDDGATLPWLYGVARNVVRNIKRTGRRSLRLRARVEAEPHYASQDVETQVVRRQEYAALIEALRLLNPNDQELLRLRAYESLTVPQISLVLGCSEEAAKKRVARAVKRLRKAAGIAAPAFTVTPPRAIQEGGER